MNKHQLWSVAVAWCRDRATAAAVLTRGLTEAWTVARQCAVTQDDGVPSPEDPGTHEPPSSAFLTRVIYSCVLDAASGSLTAGRHRETGTQDTATGLSPQEISLYIMASYSPLPREVVCELLDVPGDGSEILARVSQVLLRESGGHR